MESLLSNNGVAGSRPLDESFEWTRVPSLSIPGWDPVLLAVSNMGLETLH